MFNLTKNPRAIISMESMAESFYVLLLTKPYEDITIEEICAKAGVTRKTFYRNFETKDDLFDYYLYQVLLLNATSPSGLTPYQYLVAFFTDFQQEKGLLLICQKNNLFGLLSHSISKYIELSQTFSSLISSRDDIALFGQYFWPLINSLEVEALRVWTERNFKEKPEQLAKLLIKTMHGLGNIDYYHRVKTLPPFEE
jgi:AcrR family transcriptional regulator